MNAMAGILTPSSCRAVALALLHFLWQGTLVALLLAAANRAMRLSSARARYAAACFALAAMVTLPAATLWRLQVNGVARPSGPATAIAGSHVATDSLLPASLTPARKDRIAELAPWIVLAWLAGVAGLSIRVLGGYLVARRLARRPARPASAPRQARLAELAARLRVSRPVRLVESALVEVPTAIGILRPVILLPAGIATGMAGDQLDSLLAHELAHIRRGDCLVNLFQALAETLLFYHPAVWWVSSRIRCERENACDDLAVTVTGNALTYARALVELAERREKTLRLAVAADGGQLWKRISRLVATGDRSGSGSPRWLAAVIALGGMLALGTAAQVPEPATFERVETAAPRPTPEPKRSATVSPAPAPAVIAPEKPEPAPAPARPAARALLSPEQLIAFRTHDVTPEFIGGIVALGYTKASAEELVALRIHGVSPEYIAQMTAVFGKLPLEKYTEFRIHGLSPESSRELDATFGKLTPDEAVAMRIHGVDAAFAKAFRDAGYRSLTAEQAVSLRIHGVGPSDPEDWKRLGFGTPPVDQLLSLRIHGVTPEFAAAMRAQGLNDVSLDTLTSSRIHGVSPEFVRDIRALGYETLSAEDFIAFRIHGVSAESIRDMNRKAGGKLSAEELLDWRIRGRRTFARERERGTLANEKKEEKEEP